MSNRFWLGVILMVVLMTGGSPMSAQRPDPHGPGGERPAATAEMTPAVAGCELVVPYTRALYAEIEGAGAFATFFTSSPSFGEVSASDAQDVIRDGDLLIGKLQELDPPSVYAQAHEGVIVLMQFEIDTARFFGIDSSAVPDIAAQEKAFNDIEAGERVLAEACPAETEKVGGFVLLDVSEEPSPPDYPANPPG